MQEFGFEITLTSRQAMPLAEKAACKTNVTRQPRAPFAALLATLVFVALQGAAHYVLRKVED
jgi:hypothetical protein